MPGRDADQLPTRADEPRPSVRDDKRATHRQPRAAFLPDVVASRVERCATDTRAGPRSDPLPATTRAGLAEPAAVARDGRRVIERSRKADPHPGQLLGQMVGRADTADGLSRVTCQRPRGRDRIDEPGVVFEGAGVAPRPGGKRLGRLGKSDRVPLRRNGDGGRDGEQVAVGEQVGGMNDKPGPGNRRRPGADAGPEDEERPGRSLRGIARACFAAGPGAGWGMDGVFRRHPRARGEDVPAAGRRLCCR